MIYTAQKHHLKHIFKLEAEYAGSHETFGEFSKRYKKWSELFLICERDGVIIGEISPQITDTHIQIHSIAVEYAHWGTGIGRCLVNKFERIGRKYALSFQVASGLNVAGFYQKLDYHPVMYLWYTQQTDIETEFDPKFILDIQPRSHGFRSIFIRHDLTSSMLTKLKNIAKDDLSIIHEKSI